MADGQGDQQTPSGAQPGAASGEGTGEPQRRPADPFGPDPMASLGELADKAAQKLQDIVERVRKSAGPTADKVADRVGEATRRMSVDLEGGLDEAFKSISAQAKDLMAKGQHTRVRIKFRERQIVELPIAAVAAAEVASFAAFGPFRLVIGHLVGKAVLDVEFVSNADAHVAEGRAMLADGELEKAIACFDKALAMDRRCAAAHLGRGVCLKLRGDRAGARAAFEQAESCEPHGESGREARRHLDNLGPA